MVRLCSWMVTGLGKKVSKNLGNPVQTTVWGGISSLNSFWLFVLVNLCFAAWQLCFFVFFVFCFLCFCWTFSSVFYLGQFVLNFEDGVGTTYAYTYTYTHTHTNAHTFFIFGTYNKHLWTLRLLLQMPSKRRHPAQARQLLHRNQHNSIRHSINSHHPPHPLPLSLWPPVSQASRWASQQLLQQWRNSLMQRAARTKRWKLMERTRPKGMLRMSWKSRKWCLYRVRTVFEGLWKFRKNGISFSTPWKSVKTEWCLWKFVNFVVFGALGKK